jgi:HEPN domain-containing protein
MKRRVTADQDEGDIWWEKALVELEYARRNFEMNIYSVSVFLCHQSLEKGFKSMIITKYGEYPKMHSLKDLAMFLDAPPDVIAKCRSIDPVYSESRYTIGVNRYEEKEIAVELLKITEEVILWMETKRSSSNR